MKKVIRTIGIILIIFSCVKLFRSIRPFLFYGCSFSESIMLKISLGLKEGFGFSVILLEILYIYIIPIGLISSGIGLVKLKKLGRISALYLLTISCVIRFLGVINSVYWYCFYMKYPPPVANPATTDVVYKISMIPNYIIIFVILLIITVLTRKKVKEAFTT